MKYSGHKAMYNKTAPSSSKRSCGCCSFEHTFTRFPVLFDPCCSFRLIYFSAIRTRVDWIYAVNSCSFYLYFSVFTHFCSFRFCFLVVYNMYKYMQLGENCVKCENKGTERQYNSPYLCV